MKLTQENEERGFDTVVLVPGRVATLEEIPKMTHRMLTNLQKYGFEFKVGYSKFYEPPQVYKSGTRAGEEHGEKTVENVWVDAVHREREVKLTAVWHDGRFAYGWHGRYNPVLVNSTQLTKIIKGEVEE